MNKKKHLLFIILTVILCISVMFTAIACEDEKDTPEEETVTKLFTNGDFSTTSGETYPLTPGSWTGALGYSSAPSGADNLIAGVIDTEDSSYSKNRKTYGRVANPGKSFTLGDNDSTNVLMIYNKNNTFYKYTSSSISLTANHYYKLSFAVKTLNLSSNNNENSLAGANVFVTGSAYAEYTGINTNGEWQYKELYIQSGSSSGSFTVVAQLGAGTSSDTAALTSGHAFFDNFVLTDLTDVDDDETAFTEEDFNKITIGTTGDTTVAKYSALLGDVDMNYTSGSTSPYSASKYTTVAGFGNGDNAIISSSYVEKGILDVSKTPTLTTSYGDKTVLNLTTPSASANSKILYIQNKKATAFGYRNQALYNVKSGSDTYYKISVMVRTDIPDANSGATLKLTTGSGADNDLGYKIENINNSEWTEYSFVIKANQIRSRSVYLEMWLGQGGQEDNTHVIGSAFFDCISFTKVTQNDYENANSNVSTQVDFTTSTDNIKTIDNDLFKNDINADNLPVNSTTFNTADTSNWTNSAFSSIENPGSAVDTKPNILVINNFLPTSYAISNIFRSTDGNITRSNDNQLNNILPNSYYIISFWVKTQNINSGSGLTATLKRFDNPDNLSLDGVKASNYSSFFTSSSEFTAINTEDLTDYKSEGNNNYTEFAFYVQGNELKTAELALSFALGSGDKTSSASHISGYAFISNISIEKIEPTEYTSASASTVIKKLSLLSSAGSNEVSSNGYFNFINTTDTLSQYNEIAESKKIFDENGKLQDVYGVPTGWTVSNSDLLDKDGDSLTEVSYTKALAGIIDFTSTTHTDALNTILDGNNNGDRKAGVEQISNVLTGYNTDDYPHILMLRTNNLAKFNYTSSNLSLSANSYYIVSVWARTATTEDKLSIVLSSTTNTSTDDNYKFSNIAGHTDWKQYTFFIQTGYSAVTAKLSLYAGSNSSDTHTSSTAFFANASYASISEDAYNAGISVSDPTDYGMLNESWLTDTFDQSSGDDSLSTPSGWTGATVDTDASSDDEHVASGVFNKNISDWGDLDLDADNDSNIVDAIFNDTKTKIGNKTLVIYNKQNTAYGYTSNSISLAEDTYYKISIWILTYGLNSGDSATVTLKLNNLSYVFGKLSTSELTANEQARRINTSTYDAEGNETIGVWTQYNFYVRTEKGVTATATLNVALGAESGDNEELWRSGYVFADNFLTEKITESDFIARQPVEGETDETIDNSIIASDLVPNNFRIVFTSNDADAEEPTDEEENNGGSDTSYLWLYITSGVIGGLILIVVIVWLIKKFAPKRKFGTKKKATYDKNSDAKNNDRKNKYNS